MTIPSAICVHDDHLFLKDVIEAFAPRGEVFVFVSRLPWSGEPGDWQGSARIAEEAGATVVLGDWAEESLHRRFALDYLKEAGHTYAFIPDSDEIAEPGLLNKLTEIAEAQLADQVRVRMATYWKTTSHIVTPPEELAPVLLINVAACSHRYIREFDGGRQLTLNADFGLLHHLSYVGPDERILRKISSWSHKHEVLQGWWNQKWLAWDCNPELRDLHPTHPRAFHSVERTAVPEILAGVDSGRPVLGCPEAPENWPTVSVVIPLYGGEDDIRDCLSSLEKCSDLLGEVIVVDDVSPDDAADVADSFKIATVIRRKENGGFAAACNTGLEAANGEVVIFLNSDTVVPRAGLIRLVESLVAEERVGAVGPLSNAVAYFQKIEAPITRDGAIDGFAIDLSNIDQADEPVSMLVGFCLVMRRELADELGGFTTAFGKGMYEDNDLCYCIQRAGYELRICRRSFIYHKGSQSLNRLEENPALLMKENEKRFADRFATEVQSGFASHLPGHVREPIRFDPQRHPDGIRQRLREKSAQANISLCMIVRDEERVMRDCLNSTKDVFQQTVIVDTGSQDRTKEIIEEFDAELYEMEWPDSFSVARNKSLEYAQGDWIFWMDADDTLPAISAEIILDAAINAPDWVTGFVVPVQFLDGPGGTGTRVDHVKLFRNVPGVKFEGRIHEQILGSLRAHGGEIQRLDAVVLHSGYDTSDTGQVKKKKRDSKLLLLDLQDRPGHPFVLFNLGMTAHYNGEHEEAIDWFRQCLDVSIPEESHVRKVFALLSGSLKALGKTQDCITVLSDGLRLYADDPELLFLRGAAYMSLGKFGEARLDLERVPEGTPGHFASFDTSIQGFKKYFNLGICCQNLGDPVGERHYLLKAMEGGGAWDEAARQLFQSAEQKCNYRVCEEVTQRLEVLDQRGELWGSFFTRLCQSRGLDVAQALYGLQSLSPHDPRIGVALARHLLECGREEEAMPILLELRRTGIADGSFFLGVLAANREQYERASSFFEEVLSFDPHHIGAARNLQILRDGVAVSAEL